MNKIVMMIKASEVMAVRRAIFEAGAQRVVVNPLHSREWEAALSGWYHGKNLLWQDTPIRLDVFVEKIRANEVISAFMRTARVGMIEKITQHTVKKNSHHFLPTLQAA